MKLTISTLSTSTLLAASLVAGEIITLAPPTRLVPQPVSGVGSLGAAPASSPASAPMPVPASPPVPSPTGVDRCIAPADGMDLPGNDIGSRQAVYPYDCSDYCGSDPACMAWTWSAGTCWLKGGFGRAVFYAGAYSGVKCVGLRNSLFLVVDNCDIRGNDGESRQGASYNDCIAYRMGSFTWSDHNGGTCWFKTSVKPCEYAPNKYTGVLIY